MGGLKHSVGADGVVRYAQTSAMPASSPHPIRRERESVRRGGGALRPHHGGVSAASGRGQGVATSDEFGVTRAFMDLAARMLADPWKLAEMQTKMFWDHVALWQSACCACSERKSRRSPTQPRGTTVFRDAGWQDSILFDYIAVLPDRRATSSRHGFLRRGFTPKRTQQEGRILHAPVHRRVCLPRTSLSPTRRCCARRCTPAARNLLKGLKQPAPPTSSAAESA